MRQELLRPHPVALDLDIGRTEAAVVALPRADIGELDKRAHMHLVPDACPPHFVPRLQQSLDVLAAVQRSRTMLVTLP